MGAAFDDSLLDGLEEGLPFLDLGSLEALPLPPSPPQRLQTISLTPDQRRRLLKQLRQHYDEARQPQEDWQQRRAENYQRYQSDLSLREGRQPWKDAERLFPPLTQKHVDTMVEDTLSELFPTLALDTVVLKGIGEEDAEKAERWTQTYRWLLANIIKFRRVMRDALYDSRIDTLAVLKGYWKKEPYPADTPLGEMFAEHLSIEALDTGTLLVPPDCTGLQWPQARYLMQEVWVSPWDDFPSLKTQGYRLPPLKPEADEASLLDWDYDERDVLPYERHWLTETQLHQGQARMLEAYEVFALNEDGPREFLIVSWFPDAIPGTERESDTPDGEIARVVRLEDALPQDVFPTKTWPFFPITWKPLPRELRGQSVPQRLETAQDVLSCLAEQMVHSGRLGMLPYYFYPPGLVGNLPHLFEVQPGTGIPVEDARSVQFSPQRSDNRHYLEQMNEIRRWGEEATGITAYSQGRTSDQPNQPRTATGLTLLLNETKKMQREDLLALIEQLQPALAFGFSLLQKRQRATLRIPATAEALPDDDGGSDKDALETLATRLYGEGSGPQTFITVQPQDLQGVFDVQVSVNPDALMEQQKMVALSEQLSNILAPIWPIGQRLLLKKVWEALHLQGFDEFWPQFVATTQTELLILRVQSEIAQLQAALGQAPGAVPGQEGAQAPETGGETPFPGTGDTLGGNNGVVAGLQALSGGV